MSETKRYPWKVTDISQAVRIADGKQTAALFRNNAEGHIAVGDQMCVQWTDIVCEVVAITRMIRGEVDDIDARKLGYSCVCSLRELSCEFGNMHDSELLSLVEFKRIDKVKQ